MLHTKFQGHQPFGSGEEDLLKFLPYMGMGAILVMWPGPFEQTFIPPSHGGSIWNLTLTGLAVSEEKMFKECGRQTDGRWRPTYAISSPMSLRLRWVHMRDKGHSLIQWWMSLIAVPFFFYVLMPKYHLSSPTPPVHTCKLSEIFMGETRRKTRFFATFV